MRPITPGVFVTGSGVAVLSRSRQSPAHPPLHLRTQIRAARSRPASCRRTPSPRVPSSRWSANVEPFFLQFSLRTFRGPPTWEGWNLHLTITHHPGEQCSHSLALKEAMLKIRNRHKHDLSSRVINWPASTEKGYFQGFLLTIMWEFMDQDKIKFYPSSRRGDRLVVPRFGISGECGCASSST